jgi:hypothetical protein
MVLFYDIDIEHNSIEGGISLANAQSSYPLFWVLFPLLSTVVHSESTIAHPDTIVNH